MNPIRKFCINVSYMVNRRLSLNSQIFEKFTIKNNAEFESKVKKSKIPVIVDFYASWCNPCRTLTPRLESVLADNEGKVDLAVVDIDENTDLALNYDVGSVPVLLAVKNGKVEHRLVGLQDTDTLREWVENVLAEPLPISETDKLKMAAKQSKGHKKF